MFAFAQPVKRETSDLELILCPRQPRKLRISNWACALRYLKAQQIKRKRSARGFGVLQGWGFEICRTCPHGRDCAEETPHPRFQKGKGENNHTAVQGPVCVGGTR